MPSSSFKSSSRKPTTPTASTTSRKPQNPSQKPILRRSRSVVPVSRTHLDATSEFQNMRDNPLFWVDGSPRSEEGDFDGGVKLLTLEVPKIVGLDDLKGGFEGVGGESRRGRSVSRNSESGTKFGGDGKVGGRKDVGRSLSRVDTTRRRRSPSSGRIANSEIEREKLTESMNFRSKNKISSNANRALLENDLVRSNSDKSEILKGRNTWSSQHPAFETSDDFSINLSGLRIPHWDDVLSTSSTSEAEEKTIKPVSVEKVRVRSNSDVHSCIISDVTPELENPDSIGLVEEFREEFERELEECEERARKLRAELAVEEHRELELSKILDDIVPEPKTPVAQNIRAIRKASFERKRMSRHLEEEALAYFDECVSISTFDDSDFSSLEDLPSLVVGGDCPGNDRAGLPGVSSKASDPCSFVSQRTSLVQCKEGSPRRSRLSSSGTKPSTSSLEEDIRKYVKSFAKDSTRETSYSDIVRISHQNIDDYKSEVPKEKLLADQVTFRSRIESGRMLLCGGGTGFSVAPFSSFSR